MKKCLAVLVGLSVFAVSGAYAGCVDTYGLGSKATALGGAYAAYADDVFAVHYNPAGLSQIKRPVVSLGAHVIDPHLKISGYRPNSIYDQDYVGMGGGNFSDEFPTLVAPHGGFAIPINDKFTFGMAAYAPWGLEVRWPQGQPGMYDSYHSYYERLAVTPTISYKVNEKLSVGIGVSLGFSEAGAEKWMHYFSGSPQDQGLKNAVLAGGPTGPMAALLPAAIMDGVRIDAEMRDDFNWGVNVGVMYKPTDTITLGLTYRSPTQAKFDGDIDFTTVTGIPSMGIAPGSYGGKVKMHYDHPQQVQAGIRYQPHEKFSMEFDVVWTNWSRNGNQNESFTVTLPNVGPQSQAITYPRKWDDTRQFRFGAEYKLNDCVTLRGGYFYDPTPIPDDTLDLMWPDADKKTYSIGAGFTITPKFTIDTVFQYTDVEQDRIIGGESINMNHAHSGYTMGPTGRPELSSPRVDASADGYLLGFGITFNYLF